MAIELTVTILGEVQEALELPHPALVEKDYYVVRALGALRPFTQGEVRLVFGGGTALCRAHRVIGRMSEDIDLKIVSDGPMNRSARKAFRERITQSLVGAGFKSVESSSYDEYRTHVFELEYESLAPKVGSLRPKVKVELSSWQTYLPPIECSIGSFVSQAQKSDPEIASFPCAAIVETAAEKFVALTRRIGEERALGAERDATLLRHIYDLHRIVANQDVAEIARLIATIIPSDQATRGRKFPAYLEDPRREIRAALDALHSDHTYAESFDKFQRDMVYGERADYEACLEDLERIWAQVP